MPRGRVGVHRGRLVVEDIDSEHLAEEVGVIDVHRFSACASVSPKIFRLTAPHWLHTFGIARAV